MLLQGSSQTGAWKKPTADLDPSIGVPCVKDDCSKSLIENIESTSQEARKLSITLHEEFTLEQSNILSQDWLEYPQLRSKFDRLSTYTKYRASSSFTSHLLLQPTIIWTLSSQDGSTLINLS